jgi:hypothetical protein
MLLGRRPADGFAIVWPVFHEVLGKVVVIATAR